jgi:hypothetical protein
MRRYSGLRARLCEEVGPDKSFGQETDLFYPPRCAICRSCFGGAKTACGQHQKTLPYTTNGGKQKGDFVELCASPLYYEVNVLDALLRIS